MNPIHHPLFKVVHVYLGKLLFYTGLKEFREGLIFSERLLTGRTIADMCADQGMVTRSKFSVGKTAQQGRIAFYGSLFHELSSSRYLSSDSFSLLRA